MALELHAQEGRARRETWPNPQAMEHGGGMPWMPGTYDPELNLLYWEPAIRTLSSAGQGRPGANLWTASIVALNADTGKLVWFHQAIAARYARLGQRGNAGIVRRTL